MPNRILVVKELAEVFNIFSHPQRIQIVEELSRGEKDVNQLKDDLNTTQTRVSQHLAIMKSKNIVVERREGRHVFYHLTNPIIADWLFNGCDFVKDFFYNKETIASALESFETHWKAK